MKYQPARYAAQYPIFLAVAFFLSTALNASVCAQTRPTMSDRDRDLLARETQLREIEKPIRALPVFEQRILIRQIHKDFEQIQVVNREMMQSVLRQDPPDIRIVLKATEEIKTLAIRLKINLVLPAPENQQHSAEKPLLSETGEVKAALIRLNQTVKSFVHNPVFQSDSNVIDAKLSAKARNDLESIIELCRNIKKTAGKSEHNSGKNP